MICEYAVKTRDRIQCKLIDGVCIHQYFKICKGWYELTEGAGACGVPRKYKEKNA